jgi:hypothetical protein
METSLGNPNIGNTDIILLAQNLWSPTFQFVGRLQFGIFFGIIALLLIAGAILWMILRTVMEKDKAIDAASDSKIRMQLLSKRTFEELKAQPFTGLVGFLFGCMIFGILVFSGVVDTSYFTNFRVFPTYQLPSQAAKVGGGWVFQPNNILDFLINYTVLGSVIVLTGYMQKLESKIFGAQLVITALLTIWLVLNRMFYFWNPYWWSWEFFGAIIFAIVPGSSILFSGLRDSTTMWERSFISNLLAMAFFAIWWAVVGGTGTCWFFVYDDWEQMMMVNLILALVFTFLWMIGTLFSFSQYADQITDQIFGALKDAKDKIKSTKSEEITPASMDSKSPQSYFNPGKLSKPKTK